MLETEVRIMQEDRLPKASEPARGLSTEGIRLTYTATRFVDGKPVAEKREFTIQPYDDGYGSLIEGYQLE